MMYGVMTLYEVSLLYYQKLYIYVPVHVFHVSIRMYTYVHISPNILYVHMYVYKCIGI